MIPYIDLQLQYEPIRDEIQWAIQDVLDTRQYILGKQVADFEARFAEYCGVREAVALNSGTSALHLALLAVGVDPGDEVITVPFTFIATVAAIRYCGATPVFVDVERSTFNMDPALLEAAITPKTKAIVPVHLYGQTADMDPIRAVAATHGIAVVEDAAQAHGAEYKGRRAGGLGEIGCFSFYPTKNLGALGEGGAVTTNDAAMARKIRLLRDWGQDGKYRHTMHAFNYRMEGLQGAILGVKLRHLEKWTEQRRATAALYRELLAGADVDCPVEMSWARHVYNSYTVRVKDRDEMQRWLGEQGVGTSIHYSVPAHLQEAYRTDAYGEGSLPESEKAAAEVISLPVYPGIREEQVRRVAELVTAATSELSGRSRLR